MDIKEMILKVVPQDDYTVLNSSSFMKIIGTYGFEEFKKNLFQLETAGQLRFEYGSDGMMIFRNQ